MISLADSMEIASSEDLSAAAQIVPIGSTQSMNTEHRREIRRVFPSDSDGHVKTAIDKTAVLEIMTLPDGFNSGYLRQPAHSSSLLCLLPNAPERP